MENTTRLGLPYLIASQAQKHVTHNEALRDLDVLVQLSVKEVGLDNMPSAPEEGDRYIIGDMPTGDWALYAGHVASYQDGFWAYFAPREGWQCWAESSASFYVFSENAWLEVASGGALGNAETFGVNTDADSTNRLAVKSDAVLLTHDDVTPGNGDMRLTLNKALDAGTTSLLFQTDYSGRAELGLVGDNALSLRVSNDGADWQNGFAIDPQTGAVCFGETTDFTHAVNITGESPRLRISNLSETLAGFEIIDEQASTSQNFKVLFNCGDSTAQFDLNEKLAAKFTDDGLTLSENLDVGNIGHAEFFYCRNRVMIMHNINGVDSDPRNSNNLDHIWNNDTGNVWHFCSDTSYRANGNAVVRAASFETTSDYRLKENIVPLRAQDALSRFTALKPVAFDWKQDANMKCAKSTEGFLAHELAECVPSAVTGQKDAVQKDGKTPEYQSADYSQIIPLMVAALQGAIEKIADLESRLVAQA